jgi:hypothetical protein
LGPAHLPAATNSTKAAFTVHETGNRLMLEYTSSFATSPTGSGHGDIVTYGQDSLPASNGAVNGVVYYLKPNGEWALADFRTENTATGSLAVALGPNASDGMLLRGVVEMAAVHNGNPGDPLYLGRADGITYATISGLLGSDMIVRSVGFALDSDKLIYWNPSNDSGKILNTGPPTIGYWNGFALSEP